MEALHESENPLFSSWRYPPILEEQVSNQSTHPLGAADMGLPEAVGGDQRSPPDDQEVLATTTHRASRMRVLYRVPTLIIRGLVKAVPRLSVRNVKEGPVHGASTCRIHQCACACHGPRDAQERFDGVNPIHQGPSLFPERPGSTKPPSSAYQAWDTEASNSVSMAYTVTSVVSSNERTKTFFRPSHVERGPRRRRQNSLPARFD
ncbi:hypothetical protein BC834DRAFT_652250 [Gloeopeniophorella convolvens]|nr:hypothetical protein BC834DRAFT_652250 [Gloeopeniophorella convolvens]